jgi:hypothetical protein
MTNEPYQKNKGGRPKGDPTTVKNLIIGVRVSLAEFETLREKSAKMGMTPAQFLRETALTRRLPAPPVPAINVEQYAELARLAANFNQLSRHANNGRVIHMDNELLKTALVEVQRLRQALLGVGE